MNIKNWLNAKGFNFIELEDHLYDKNINFSIFYLSFNKIYDKDYCFSIYKSCVNKFIIILEDEWSIRTKQTQDFILAKLGKFSNKLYARKCKLLEVNKKDAVKFICDNHIQPIKNGGIINFGLFDSNELLGLLQIRLHHRNNKDLTISRICFKEGWQIVGGFSRLISHAIDWGRQHHYNEVVTWSDNRFTDGNSYILSGFELSSKCKPEYYYIHPNCPGLKFNKQNMQKSRIGCPKNYTEKEWTAKLGYIRLWDAGKNKYIYYINKKSGLKTRS